MNNITTIVNGFIFNEIEYIFEGNAEILNDTQTEVPTNKGFILLDLSCTINENAYTNINDFLTALYA